MLLDPVLLTSLLVMLSVAAFAYWAGGPTERAGAALAAGGAVGTALAWLVSGRPDPVVPFALMDLALLIGFMALGWRSRRSWPLAAAVFQGAAVAIHLIRLASPGLAARTYLIALAVPGCGVLAALSFAAFRNLTHNRVGRSS